MRARRVLLFAVVSGAVNVGVLLIAAQPAAAHHCQDFTDCFATADAASDALLGLTFLGMLSMALDFVPYVGTAKGLIEAATGRDLLTGQELTAAERFLGIIPGRLGRLDELASGSRHLDEMADVPVPPRPRGGPPPPPPPRGPSPPGRPPPGPPPPTSRGPGVPEPPGRRTEPSRPPSPDNRPRGEPEPIPPNASPELVRSLTKQRESADLLTQHGYEVEHLRPVRGQPSPDYLIEGRRFDHKAPRTDSAKSLADHLARDATRGQADRFVVNLDRLTPDRPHPMDLDALRAQLSNPEYDHIMEIIVVRDGEVIRFWPPAT